MPKGVEHETRVVFGEDESVFGTIDRGSQRSLGDDLAVRKEKNAHATAAALNIVFGYSHGFRSVGVMGPNGSSTEELEFFDSNPGIRDSVAYAVSRTTSIPIVKRIIGACHYMFGLKSVEARDEFFEKLSTGGGLEVGDPILSLRNRLYEERLGKSTSLRASSNNDDFMGFYFMIRAWNVFRDGERLTRMQAPRMVDYGSGDSSRKILAPLPDIR